MWPPIAARNETIDGEIQNRDNAAQVTIKPIRPILRNLAALELPVFTALIRMRIGPIISPITSTLPMVLVTMTPAISRVGNTANALGATAKLKNIIEPSHPPRSNTSTNERNC